MAQDNKTKHAYEHTAQMEKKERAEGRAEDALNAAFLQADQHTGQQGLLPADGDTLNAADVKDAYDPLHQSGWHRDEIARLRLVAPGTRLQQGDIFLDLRNPAAGELVAHGEETVGGELLVPKRGTDYEIWEILMATRGGARNTPPALIVMSAGGYFCVPVGRSSFPALSSGDARGL